MNAPVLQDLMGKNFTEGDRVVYASTNGIRVGKVEWIKDVTSSNSRISGGDQSFRVYINLSEHHNLVGHSKMYAKKQGYDYAPQHFLKVSELD